MIILGIDPGTARIGYGVIKKEDNGDLKHLESGTISPKNKELPDQLKKISEEIFFLIKKHNPAIVGVEKIYFSKNQKTAIEVAQARGVIVLKTAEFGVPCVEVSPTEIKLAVSGNGKATKKGVAKMVGHFLKIETKGVLDDTTDALATAIAAEAVHKTRSLGG